MDPGVCNGILVALFDVLHSSESELRPVSEIPGRCEVLEIAPVGVEGDANVPEVGVPDALLPEENLPEIELLGA